jgi:hypothetical protein
MPALSGGAYKYYCVALIQPFALLVCILGIAVDKISDFGRLASWRDPRRSRKLTHSARLRLGLVGAMSGALSGPIGA